LGTVVGVAEDRAENSEGGCVVEDGAEGDGGGLDGWEVWRGGLARQFEEPFHFKAIEMYQLIQSLEFLRWLNCKCRCNHELHQLMMSSPHLRPLKLKRYSQ
jgi:hypothetical protein